MISFLKRFSEHVKKTPELTAVVDRGGERKKSYAELDEESGRIASWLKNQGIGREDVVAICVPRGFEFIAVRFAVMKTGAAWVGTEAMMGKERIEYVIKDSGAVLVMDETNYSEALKEEPLDAKHWSDPDPHDLAYIYYTSGSTGRPKGVLQEYGVYEYIMSSTDRAIGRWIPLNYANVAPETFVGGLYLMMGNLQAGCTLHLIPLNLVRDPAGLLVYFKKEHVNASCMPPTLVKVLESAGGIDAKVLHVTGEIATDLFIDRFPLMNAYGPTEFSYLPFFFDVDKTYSNTPIGKPDENTKLVLLDENGEINPNEGTLCIRLPFFRGYLNDETRADFVNIEGETYFKSSDYMSVDKNGNYTLLGRVDDMVKINGNRIEPAEVEFALKKVLSTDYIAVKAWERGGGRFLCAYHTTGKELDAAQMAQKLKGMIPDYMIPSCYVAIGELPLNENGKVNKKALPQPGDEVLFAPYFAPEDELQKKLCEQFAKVLGISDRQIGIDDDFFLLGGDSVAALNLIVGMADNFLTLPLIYRKRTVRGLARALRDNKEHPDAGETDHGFDTLDNRALQTWPLSEEQLYFAEYKKQHADRIIYNMPVVLYFVPETDEKKLERALLFAFEAHPSLLTVIKETPEGWIRQYCPQNNVPVESIKTVGSDTTEIVDDFIKPFTYDGSALFRRRILRTPEAVMLLLDVDHIICDGTSLRILIEDILALYEGKSISEDMYFALLEDQLKSRGSEALKKDREYFENTYKGEYDTLLRPDLDETKPVECTLEVTPDFTSKDVGKAAGRLHLSVSAFYMLGAALSLAAYNLSDKVMISWNYHGRSDLRAMRSVGLFIRDYPVEFILNREDTLGKICADLMDQLGKDMLHGSVSPFMDRKKGELLCFLYQGELMKKPESPVLMEVELPEIPERAAIEPMEVRINEDGDEILAEITYDAGIYRSESMERFGVIYEDICSRLLEEGVEKKTVCDLIPGVWNEKK